MRIGHGYDVHRFSEGRKLILGGVEIPYEYGLSGHSDADVLTHAVMDAMLGACALGDIGKHFPDTDERYEGADSIELLKAVRELIKDKGYELKNLDVTVLCEKPKLRTYIESMRCRLSEALKRDMDDISIKATTEEGLGFTGAGLGIAVHAVCLVDRIED
ncbi:MAG TPA: 2-C-methyl-D-erythritol 2,4-cyclodiphosphate synthase [Candidatus Avilachnospira avistercoris]|nr:2-C-methyl-D-erythritol 2,4-cyclodiphosphate synthase [Candidatus Avilachnospira avistercoris]